MSNNKPYFGPKPANVYGRPMKEILLDFINHQNNRDIDPSYLIFGKPTKVGDKGEVVVGVEFSTSSGWESGDGMLRYQREHIRNLTREGKFIIHSEDLTEEGIRTALFEQYGIYLDDDTFSITEIDEDDTDSDENGAGEPTEGGVIDDNTGGSGEDTSEGGSDGVGGGEGNEEAPEPEGPVGGDEEPTEPEGP